MSIIKAFQDTVQSGFDQLGDLLGGGSGGGIDGFHHAINAEAYQLMNPDQGIPIQNQTSENRFIDVQTLQGTDVPIPVIYGTRKTGGILVYQETSANNGVLHQCYALAEGVQQQWTVQVDDVSLASSKFWRDTGNGTGYGIGDRLIYANGFGDGNWAWGTGVGNDAGIPDPDYGAGASWAGSDNGASHKMKGIACEMLSYLYKMIAFPGYEWGVEGGTDPDIWNDGLPKITFLMTGKALVDSAGNSASSTDPAWQLYDYMTNTRYGASIPASEIDAQSFIDASSICGQTNSGVKRHESNIIIDTGNTILENVKQLLATCNGRLSWINGKYYLKIDDTFSGTPAFAFTDNHIIGGISIDLGNLKDRMTQVTATWINPDKGYKSDEVSYPDINNDSSTYSSFKTADNDVVLTKTIKLDGVTNWHQARYLAKQACLKSRDNLKVAFLSTAEAMNVVVGDIITITHSTPAWTAKEFRVRSIKLNTNGTVSISATEHNDAVYAWDTATIPTEAPNTTLPDATNVTVPTNLVSEETSYSSLNSSGKRIRITLTWTATVDPYVKSYDFAFKKSTDSGWTDGGNTITTTGILNDFEKGTFDFRVRARNVSDFVSDWVTSTGNLISGVASAPPDVTDFSVSVQNNQAVAGWTVPDDTNVTVGGKIQVRVLNAGITDWSLGRILANASATMNLVQLPIIASNVGTYVAKFFDAEGNESINHVSDTIDPSNVVQTEIGSFAEHSAWAGTFPSTASSGLEIIDDGGGGADSIYVTFENLGLFDDFDTNIDTWVNVDSRGGIKSEGSYIGLKRDLGAVYNSNISTVQRVTTEVIDGSDYIDSWTDTHATVNQRPLWDGTSLLADVITQIRTTNDDPASGSATWSDYSTFTWSKVKARGYQMKVNFKSSQASTNSKMYDMTLKMSLDQRDELKSGLSSSTPAFTYDDKFYATPTLSITPENLQSGDYYTITSASGTGATVTFYNSSNSVVTRNFSYIARGH